MPLIVAFILAAADYQLFSSRFVRRYGVRFITPFALCFSEDAHWRTEDPYTMTYELPRSVDEYSLPGNETADFQRECDRRSPRKPPAFGISAEKPLNDWEPSDVMQWICEEYSRNNRDYETVPLRRFADVSVGDLRRMEIADFYAILQCQESAEFLHRCKERLFAERKFEAVVAGRRTAKFKALQRRGRRTGRRRT